MYIEDLDEVTELRNKLKRYETLRACAKESYFSDCVVGGIKVFNVISADRVRDAIAEECDHLIATTKDALGALGVNTAVKLEWKKDALTGEGHK